PPGLMGALSSSVLQSETGPPHASSREFLPKKFPSSVPSLKIIEIISARPTEAAQEGPFNKYSQYCCAHGVQKMLLDPMPFRIQAVFGGTKITPLERNPGLSLI